MRAWLPPYQGIEWCLACGHYAASLASVKQRLESRWMTRLSWGARGLLLLVACLVATLVSPVMSYRCDRSQGSVACRITRHALGVIPYAWTRIQPVADASSAFTPSRRVRAISDGGWAIAPSVTTNAIRAKGSDESLEWTTYSSIGADPGTIAIAIDALVAGGRAEPLLAWQADAWVVFFVFIVGLPFAAAMIARPCSDRLGVPRERRLKVIERSYVATLVLGAVAALAIFWGSVPALVAYRLGLPIG